MAARQWSPPDCGGPDPVTGVLMLPGDLFRKAHTGVVVVLSLVQTSLQRHGFESVLEKNGAPSAQV